MSILRSTIETTAASDLTVYKVVRIEEKTTFRRHQSGKLYCYTTRAFKSRYNPEARSGQQSPSMKGTVVPYKLRRRMTDLPGNNGFYTYAKLSDAFHDRAGQHSLAILECIIPKDSVIRYGRDEFGTLIICAYTLIPQLRIAP